LYRYFVSQSSEFRTITLCVASQRVIPKVNVYFVIDSVRKLLDIQGSIGRTGFGWLGIESSDGLL
jgi:hypothetical protein